MKQNSTVYAIYFLVMTHVICGKVPSLLDSSISYTYIIAPVQPHTISVAAEIQIGELIDKLTILDIKRERIADPAKLYNITTEFDTLLATYKEHVLPYVADNGELHKLTQDLKEINAQLWDIEDLIRDKERDQNFNHEFIQLARSVYYTNDQRCRIKREINMLVGSRLIEEKSYSDYVTTELK